MPGPILWNSGRHCVCDHVDIERPGVGRHRAEELIQRFRIARELDTRKVVGPHADAESVEPYLLVRRGGDGGLHSAAAGISAPRLIDEINRKATSQKNVLIALAAV
jgi:hypothetical protein